MPSCSVPSCINNNTNCKGKGVQFHRFPVKNPVILSEWKKVCGERELNLENARVCSDHFQKGCYVKKPDHLIVSESDHVYVLCKTAVPTEKLSCNKTVISNTKSFKCAVKSCPKEYELSRRKIELNNGPLDYEEVKHEIDLNTKLQEISRQLEAEKKLCEKKINTIDKSIRTARVNAFRMKKQNKAEDKMLGKIFSRAQINVLLGRKAIWTNNDLATAFTVRHMGSKKCYLYMKNVLKIPLPALSCVQKWAATKNV